MRQVAVGICFIVGVCSANPAVAQKCGADFMFEDRRSYEAVQREQKALSDAESLGISRSSSSWVLFDEFAKRFSIVGSANDRDDLRDLQSIMNTGGEDRDELTFVLLNLFTWSGIDAERVQVFTVQKDVDPESFVPIDLDRVLVYLPALDQVFDPILPLAEQHQGSGWTLLAEKPRIHFAYPMWRSAGGCPPIRGYHGRRSSGAGP